MALNISIDKPKNGLDLSESGKLADGSKQSLDRRLFMQLLVFTGSTDTPALIEALDDAGIEGVLYEDVNDPYGVALLTFAEAPEHFVSSVRGLVQAPPFRTLTPRPKMTMFGRTYTIGYERDLEDTLLKRPRRHVANPAWPWAVWYPLRRDGAFERLGADEQRTMLMEHGGIGRAYGKSDYAHDIRLACHGLDQADNDFVTGLVGKELFPLSAIVQHMRKTRQTAEYLTSLGPFFVGKAVWQNASF